MYDTSLIDIALAKVAVERTEMHTLVVGGLRYESSPIRIALKRASQLFVAWQLNASRDCNYYTHVGFVLISFSMMIFAPMTDYHRGLGHLCGLRYKVSLASLKEGLFGCRQERYFVDACHRVCKHVRLRPFNELRAEMHPILDFLEIRRALVLSELDCLVAVVCAGVDDPIAVSEGHADVKASRAAHNPAIEVLGVERVAAAGGEKAIDNALQPVVVLEYVAVLLFCQVRCTDVDMKAARAVYLCTDLVEALADLFESAHAVGRAQDGAYNLVGVVAAKATVIDNLEMVAVVGMVVALGLNVHALATDALNECTAVGVVALDFYAEGVAAEETRLTNLDACVQECLNLFVAKAEHEKVGVLFVAAFARVEDSGNLLVEGFAVGELKTVGELGACHSYLRLIYAAGVSACEPFNIGGPMTGALSGR